MPGERINLPAFKIYLNDNEINSTYGISMVRIFKSVNRIATAHLVLLDGSNAGRNFQMSGSDTFVPGNELTIKAGYNNEEEIVYKGIIVRHGIKSHTDQSSVLAIELKDKSVKMTLGRKNKYFTDSNDSSIIEDIINLYNIENTVEATDKEHPYMVQYNCTDWDFILSRAEVNGKLILVNNGGIEVKAPSLSGQAQLELTYGDNIIEFDMYMDARDQLSAVKGKAWDFSSQELAEAEASDPGLEEHGNISSSDLSAVIGLEEFDMFHSGALSEEELKSWADAKLLRSRLAKVRGRVKIQGRADINPGDIIQLAGVGDRFNGKAYVASILHHYSAHQQWFTEIQFGLSQEWIVETFDNIQSKPASGLLPGAMGLHIGVVTKIHDDPDGEHRVKVRLPLISTEEEGVWARVSTLDAGADRGSFFRPEVNDEVTVGFINNDPRFPVILGMMNSSAKNAPISATEDNFEKGFITKNQIRLIFNDDKKSFTVETPNQNKIVITDEDDSILLQDKNGNKLLMNADGITIESSGIFQVTASSGDINVDGMNVNLKASSNFVAEGTSGADFKSSGKATIKGSIVGIN